MGLDREVPCCSNQVPGGGVVDRNLRGILDGLAIIRE
jgi:hypothetical protein